MALMIIHCKTYLHLPLSTIARRKNVGLFLSSGKNNSKIVLEEVGI